MESCHIQISKASCAPQKNPSIFPSLFKIQEYVSVEISSCKDCRRKLNYRSMSLENIDVKIFNKSLEK
jgi:hypothetical protein